VQKAVLSILLTLYVLFYLCLLANNNMMMMMMMMMIWPVERSYFRFPQPSARYQLTLQDHKALSAGTQSVCFDVLWRRTVSSLVIVFTVVRPTLQRYFKTREDAAR